MRVFVALDIDDAIRQRLQLFLDGVRGFAPDARWVRPESMHVTLKFIGEKSAEASRKSNRRWVESGLVSSRFPFAATASFLPPGRRAFSGLPLKLGRNLLRWRSRWTKQSPRSAFRKKNMPSVRISLWPVEGAPVRRVGVRAMHPTSPSSGCRRNWPRCPLLSLVR